MRSSSACCYGLSAACCDRMIHIFNSVKILCRAQTRIYSTKRSFRCARESLRERGDEPQQGPGPGRPHGPLHFIMAPLAILSRWQQQVSQARAREQLGNRIIRCDVRYPDVGYNPISGYPTSYAISVYPDIVPDIGYLLKVPDIGFNPISGTPRYRV